MTSTNVKLESGLHVRAKVWAAGHGTTLQALVNEGLELVMEKLEKGAKRQ